MIYDSNNEAHQVVCACVDLGQILVIYGAIYHALRVLVKYQILG